MIVIDLFYSSVMLMPVCVSVPFFFSKSLMFVIVHGRCHLIKILTREYPFPLFFMLFLKIMLCASMMFEPHTQCLQ